MVKFSVNIIHDEKTTQQLTHDTNPWLFLVKSSIHINVTPNQYLTAQISWSQSTTKSENSRTYSYPNYTVQERNWLETS